MTKCKERRAFNNINKGRDTDICNVCCSEDGEGAGEERGEEHSLHRQPQTERRQHQKGQG